MENVPSDGGQINAGTPNGECQLSISTVPERTCFKTAILGGCGRLIRAAGRRRLMNCSILVMAGLVLLFGSLRQATADSLSPHGLADAVAQSNETVQYSDHGHAASASAAYSDKEYWNDGSLEYVVSGTAGAFASSDNNRNVFGYANATQGGNTTTRSSSGSIASWRDVLHLSGSSSLPDAVTFNFHVVGSFSLNEWSPDPQYGSFAQAEFEAFVGPPASLVIGGSALATLSTQSSSSLAPVVGDPGWSSLQIGGGVTGITGANAGSFNQIWAFSGTFSYTTGYDPSLGGYGFTVEETVSADAFFNDVVNAQFNDPITANFVTNTDGSPLTGFTLSFDSGLSIQNASAVPEPSSFALLGLGGIGLASRMYRRRSVVAF
jgi:hypothetical protein